MVLAVTVEVVQAAIRVLVTRRVPPVRASLKAMKSTMTARLFEIMA
jgi:hypothetical protein